MRSDPSKRNPDFWCEFHNDHGHRTADCRLLQGEVKHLLKQGYLTDMFSEKGRQSYMKNRQEPPKPPSPKRTVNIITGEYEVNGVTYTSAKKTSKVTVTHGKRVRQDLDGDNITFDDEDVDSLMIPHNDALVISLPVHDTNVKRVLIHPGSSVNIILLWVVNEIQDNDKVIPKARTLSGFNNSSVITKGEVLLTTFAEGVVKDTMFQQLQNLVEDIGANTSTKGIPGQTDVDLRPDSIQEPEENENIKTTAEELEAIVLFTHWPDRKVYVGAKLSPEVKGKTMEVYIGDMLVKLAQEGDHFQHLLDTFEILRKYNMKLNPEKCAFGMASDQSYRGNTGYTHEKKRSAEINRKNSSPGENQFEWTNECQQALKDLKSYLSNPPLLAKPKHGERLLIYLVVSEVAVLADFVEDFSTNLVPDAENELQVLTGSNSGIWTLFTDSSSNVKGAGLGIVLIPPSGEVIRQAIKCYPITNNEAEYEAVIAGLELARELGIEQIVIKSNSQLVVNQMQGTYVARETQMQQYLEKVRELLRQFQSWKAVQIPREENAENAIVIHLFHSALDQDKSEVNFNNLTWDWRNEFVNFLQYGILPEDKKKSQLFHQKDVWYCLVRGNLY
ncbi:uncharacterized protein LOC142166795 [Nicotiana tabacum]|uniref:Uncharacterized protein LOC142166795 n=1 Tax=Nicotiana tabacum TaxID=4097 RepID=A0AC58SBA6_TOBAC